MVGLEATARRWADDVVAAGWTGSAATLVWGVGHDVLGHQPHLALMLTFDVALALPLLGRRRGPLRTFLVVAAIALVQWFSGVFVGGDVAVLVALYSVGAHSRRRDAVVLAALTSQLGVVLAVTRWAPPGQAVSGALLLTGTVTAAWVMGVYRRTRRDYLASVLERAATAEREGEQQALLATAAERARIAREMHDIVAHSLSVIIALNDGAVASVRRSPDEAEEALRLASTLGRQSLGEVRRLLGTVHDQAQPDRVPAPDLSQLDDLVASVRAAGLAVELTMQGAPHDVPASAQLTVYRMVQEALTNVLKHAPQARRATVTLRFGAADIDVEVVNDGPDDPNPAPGSPVGSVPGPDAHVGQGLNGMRERVGMFAGTVEAAPRPGGGWRVASRLRLDAPTSRAVAAP